ncbi:MAG: ATP-binding cassette domain-containing protein [Ginsengibacter sp.]
MPIVLNKIFPKYFDTVKTDSSDVWLKDIAFKAAQKIQIVAPSGSGKTSLIHFIYGLRSDYNGEISINDTNINTADAEKLSLLRREAISVVFQDLRLFDEQSMAQNLDVKNQLSDYYPKAKILEMARRLGVAEKLNTLAKICSYGEKQRFAIIRALLQPFNFLLLDEPFSHLDGHNRNKALALILEECEKRKAALILADLQKAEDFPADNFLFL